MNRTARLTLLSIAALAALLAVVWAMPFGAAPSAQAVEGPSITVNKVCTPEATVGGFVRYNFTITNNGSVSVDIDTIRSIATLPQVHVLDDAHEGEHSLEVHLPFLQVILESFRLVPLAARSGAREAVPWRRTSPVQVSPPSPLRR